MRGWIGVDLDGTLAEYHGWRGLWPIGAPVPAMLARVKRWLADDGDVRIMTARVSGPDAARAQRVIAAWCGHHIGVALPVTCQKDFGMRERWDDRAIQVEVNTGRRMDGHPVSEPTP